MKKLLSILVMALLVVPAVAAVSVGSGIDVDIETEDFPPMVWQCDNRVVYDDNTEPGRITEGGEVLLERHNNYAFEGEQIKWKVLVLDKNGLEKIEDVFATIGDVQGEGNDIEVNCQLGQVGPRSGIDENCNAYIGEERIDPEDFENWEHIAAYYTCTFTVETPESHYGEYWITVEALDLDGLSGTMDENEYWFLNPEIALSIEGDLVFEDVRPGTMSYSETILVGNDADDGSGVILDMFISGTDFYDSSSSGAMCPTSNVLSLNSFAYYATNGAYSTTNDAEVNRDCDAEGYCEIGYGIGFNDPDPFYNEFEILQANPMGAFWGANMLTPGAEMTITFRLDLPVPCNGDFDSGQIYFWGEAI
ncbi:MAG: hypothetical protein ABIB79_05445 [archaeon]